MKTGITGPIHAFGEDRYAVMRRCGFDSCDLQIADTTKPPYTLTEDEMTAWAESERALAEAAGIVINQVHGPWDATLSDTTPQGRAERLEKAKIAARISQIVGAQYLVMHPIMPHGSDDSASERKMDYTFRTTVEFMRELSEFALLHGVTVCLENMPFPDYSLSTPDRIAAVIDAVNLPSLKMCLDVGHAVMFDEWKPEISVRRFGKHIATIHAHDNNGTADTHNLPMYRGIVDWYEFARALREVVFDGSFSLECMPPIKLPAPVYEDALCALSKFCRIITEG